MNRLAHEKSPYLLQHKDNPVDWFPWGEEAFKKAAKEDRPIFLSIGYSTCHWCHVMERECFEDPEVAKLLNETFVNIKVDREERPDIDGTYMSVCQLTTGGGGWPLTIIMTPDKRPFFAGTFFPKNERFGRPGLLDIVPKVRDMWENRRGDVLNAADTTVHALSRVSGDAPGLRLDDKVLVRAYEDLGKAFDNEHGGFGHAPKFPSPHTLMFLLRYWNRTKEPGALEMATRTLTAMRLGGIYDHVGLGFHRYSTDGRWFLPHFEKMLYDQALHVMAYTEAYQATGNELFSRTAREVSEYVLRDMTSAEGGFLSAEDADTEGVEGRFYVWTRKELIDVLGDNDGQWAADVLNVTDEGNYTEEATGEKVGTNVLFLRGPVEDEARFDKVRKALFEHRKGRIGPGRDDKILTDWNGLMIAALSRAYQVFGEERYLDAAKRAADLLLDTMRDQDGRLLHRYKDGEAAIRAYIDDHAFLAWGLLELYEASLETRDLANALWLNKDMLDHFWDEEVGGFYLTASDGEEILVRQKETYDGAIPSGNSVAMLVLLRIARMVHDPRAEVPYEERAAALGRAFAERVRQGPTAHTFLLSALDLALGPSYELVVVGPRGAEDTKAMLRAVRKEFIPNKVMMLRPTDDDEGRAGIDDITGFTKDQVSLDGKATAYVCIGHGCKAPTTDIFKALELMRAKERPEKKSVKTYKVG